jgi:hypothetical protein
MANAQEKYEAIEYVVLNGDGCNEWAEAALWSLVQEIVGDVVKDLSKKELDELIAKAEDSY